MIAASAPGLVLGRDVKPRDAALADEVADQHVGEQVRVDIAAAQQGRDLLALEALGVGQHRGEARRARALDHGLFDADQHRDRAFEVALGDQHDVVGIVLEDPRGELARLLDRNALGQRVAAQRHLAAWIAHFIDG